MNHSSGPILQKKRTLLPYRTTLLYYHTNGILLPSSTTLIGPTRICPITLQPRSYIYTYSPSTGATNSPTVTYSKKKTPTVRPSPTWGLPYHSLSYCMSHRTYQKQPYYHTLLPYFATVLITPSYLFHHITIPLYAIVLPCFRTYVPTTTYCTSNTTSYVGLQ